MVFKKNREKNPEFEFEPKEKPIFAVIPTVIIKNIKKSEKKR